MNALLDDTEDKLAKVYSHSLVHVINSSNFFVSGQISIFYIPGSFYLSEESNDVSLLL